MGCSVYYNTCDLCSDKCISVTKVCIQDNYQILKQRREFQIICKKHNPYSYLLMCELCLMKLRIFVKCDAGDFNQDIFCRMQDSPQKAEENLEHIEDTNCQCEHCKAKFGNLPLLAEVIEKIEKNSSQQRYPISKTEPSEQSEPSKPETAESEKPEAEIPKPETVQNTVIDETIVQPSTSRETTSRKIMNCEHCGKSFTHKGDLNKHLRKHTGEQPFQCPICDRKFAHTSNLARHLRVHSGDKPFRCERCNKNFSRKDKLIMHQKTKLCMNAATSTS